MDNLPTIQPYNLPKVRDQASLEQATSLLSTLNRQLDTLTEHKEAKTKPINEALKKIREDYKPLESKLQEAIAEVKQAITTYATEQVKQAWQARCL